MKGSSGWGGFSAFQVFGDHVPMDGFKLVVRISVDAKAVSEAISSRAAHQEALDPEFARCMLRAGLGAIATGFASFVYANAGQTVVVLRSDAVREVGQSLEIHDQIVSSHAARLALLVGQVLPVVGDVYEFPDLMVVRKAVVALQEELEEATPGRSSDWLGAQLRGRGEPFHPSMVDSLEEQMALLQTHGVDLDRLPHWWWRGAAARRAGVGSEVEIFEDLSDLSEGQDLGALIA